MPGFLSAKIISTVAYLMMVFIYIFVIYIMTL